MTRNDAEAILADESLPAQDIVEYLQFHKPVALTVDEIIEEVVQYADSDVLDIIGRKFYGLIRQGGVAMVNGMGASDPETDSCFRDRILSRIGGPPKPKAHVHSWKTYQGFTEVYDYCTGCDEKRK